VQYLHQFVLHASLDAVDEQLWTTTNMHLGVVDKFNNLQVNKSGILQD
jgi:trafficking protein particle complex subunit 2